MKTTKLDQTSINTILAGLRLLQESDSVPDHINAIRWDNNCALGRTGIDDLCEFLNGHEVVLTVEPLQKT